MIKWQGRPRGLGVIISQLSFYLACGPAEVLVPNRDNLAFDIKRIWQIPDDELIVRVGDDQHAVPNIESDELCTFVPYLSKDVVRLYDQKFSVGARHKPCVAVCMHQGSGLGEDLAIKSMPYNKYSTKDQYAQIVQKLCDLGYDPIIINRRDMTLEQKTYLLNELCEFVIGYEGGLHHLAHCLRIPCMVLPWRYNDMGHEPVRPGIYYETHRFHADRKTYFLNTVDDFLSMTNDDVHGLLKQLHDDQGNNVLWSPTVTINLETLRIRCRDPFLDLTPRICWDAEKGKQIVDFIKDHLPVQNMIQYAIQQ